MSNTPDIDKYCEGTGQRKPFREDRVPSLRQMISRNSEKLLWKASNRILFIEQALFLMMISVGVPVVTGIMVSLLKSITVPEDNVSIFIENAVFLIAITFGIFAGFAGIIGMSATAGKIIRGEKAVFTDLFMFANRRYVFKVLLVILLFGLTCGIIALGFSKISDGAKALMGLAVRYYGNSGYYGVAFCLAFPVILFTAFSAVLVSLAIFLIPLMAQYHDEGIVFIARVYYKTVAKNFKKVVSIGILSVLMAIITVAPIGIMFILFFIPRFVMDYSAFAGTVTGEYTEILIG